MDRRKRFVAQAEDKESVHALPLIDKARERGRAGETYAVDKGVHPTLSGL